MVIVGWDSEITMDLPQGPDILVRADNLLLAPWIGFERGEMAVRGGTITAIARKGSLPSEEKRGLEVLDVARGFVCPAFYDSHMHLYQWSISRSAVDLSGTRSWEQAIEHLVDVSDGRAENSLFDGSGLLVGVDYDDSTFIRDTPPSLEGLDRTFGRTPVLIRRVCGHVVHLNTAAAETIGIPLERIEGGPLRDDEAMSVSWRVPFDHRTIKGALSKGIETLLSLGIAGGVEVIPAKVVGRMIDDYLGAGGGLRLSLSIYKRKERSVRGNLNRIDEWSVLQDAGGGTCGTITPEIMFEKYFMDGSIGAGTACFSKEFTKEFPFSPLLEEGKTLEEKVASGYDDGFVPMVHAIGDRAISAALNVLEPMDVPYRIEHSEAITAPILNAMADKKGALSLQPNFQRVWGGSDGMYRSKVGGAYLQLNPFSTVNKAGVRWCFGSDMMPPGPLFGLKGATDHPDLRERLDAITALRGYSEMSSALSLRGSSRMGKLMEGTVADIVVLSPDFSEVVATYVSGVRKYPPTRCANK